jgi:hypothetical protein
MMTVICGDITVSKYMIFDVESVGLHGEGFAVGYVVVNGDGATLEEGIFHCDPELANGSDTDRRWVGDNVPTMDRSEGFCAYPADVRFAFWDAWQRWKECGATLWADCAWPVEARFLAQCVDDDPEGRTWEGPYPLHEIATAALLCGRDPLVTLDRLPNELPVHNPLTDARQSARVFLEYAVELGEVWDRNKI